MGPTATTTADATASKLTAGFGSGPPVPASTPSCRGAPAFSKSAPPTRSPVLQVTSPRLVPADDRVADVVRGEQREELEVAEGGLVDGGDDGLDGGDHAAGVDGVAPAFEVVRR